MAQNDDALYRYPRYRPDSSYLVRETVRRAMQGNRSAGTEPERHFRQALRSARLTGYRINMPGLPGRPDVVFTRWRVAAFVHGCYWHGCPTCRGYRTPAANSAYWDAKIEANRGRFRRVQVALQELGYVVLVVWECEVRADPAECAMRVAAILAERRASLG